MEWREGAEDNRRISGLMGGMEGEVGNRMIRELKGWKKGEEGMTCMGS